TRDDNMVCTHNGRVILTARTVTALTEIDAADLAAIDAVVVEEAQFLPRNDVYNFVRWVLRPRDISVLVVCLATDMFGNPFGTAAQEVVSLEPTRHVIFNKAACRTCRTRPATHTAATPEIMRGTVIQPGADGYFSLCVPCMDAHLAKHGYGRAQLEACK